MIFNRHTDMSTDGQERPRSQSKDTPIGNPTANTTTKPRFRYAFGPTRMTQNHDDHDSQLLVTWEACPAWDGKRDSGSQLKTWNQPSLGVRMP